jgi:hypothetical protein
MYSIQDKYEDLVNQINRLTIRHNNKKTASLKFELIERPTNSKTFIKISNQRIAVILNKKSDTLEIKYADMLRPDEPKEEYEFELVNADLELPQYWVNYFPTEQPRPMITNQKMAKSIVNTMLSKLNSLSQG